MTSLNLIPRAGEMILNFGISSSGDDARTVNIPFGTLATEGGSIVIPKALKLSIESSSGIPISSSDVVCQAFKNTQGTQVLGKSFTQSGASSLGPEPVTIGSIFCSDAKGVQAHIGGNGASGETSSAGSDVATTQNVQTTEAQIFSTAVAVSTAAATGPTSIEPNPVTKSKAAILSTSRQAPLTTPSPSPAIDPSGNGGKPKTIQQMSSIMQMSSMIMMDTSSAQSFQSNGASSGFAPTAPKRPTTPSTISSAAAATGSTLSGTTTSSGSAAAQATSAAYSVHTPQSWTVKRLVNMSVIVACYIGWFIL